MLTLDAQVHAYERNHSGRHWVGTLHGPAEVTGDQMVVAMDAVGVDGAVLVSPFSMYRYDASYAKEVYATHPTGRYGRCAADLGDFELDAVRNIDPNSVLVAGCRAHDRTPG